MYGIIFALQVVWILPTGQITTDIIVKITARKDGAQMEPFEMGKNGLAVQSIIIQQIIVATVGSQVLLLKFKNRTIMQH